MIISFIYFWGINKLESDSSSKKRIEFCLVITPLLSPSHTKGSWWQMKKAFMGIIVHQRETLVSYCSEAVWYNFIPRNLAIKDKVCSTFCTGHYSTSFHMKTKNGYFCYYLYDFCFYDINLHWSSTFSFLGGMVS